MSYPPALPDPYAPPAPRLAPDAAPPPPKRCHCGAAIGDGDYASGHRQCALHRRGGRARQYVSATPRR